MNTSKYSKFLIYVLLPVWVIGFLSNLRAGDVAPLRAHFKEIRQTALGLYGIYTITNIGKRDIDDVILYLSLKNKNGDTLSSTAITDSTPGLVWLKAGESTEEGVPLDRRKAAKALLETNPEEGDFVIEVKSITFLNP